MNEKTREELVAAAESAFSKAGASCYEDGIKLTRKLLSSIDKLLQANETKDKLRTTLDSAAPASRMEEKTVLLCIRSFPQLLRVGLKMAAQKAVETLPAPPGGRPTALPDASQREAMLDYIVGLHRKGASLDAAKLRAGQRYLISKRTVDRLWQNRMKPAEDEPTFEDAVRYFASGDGEQPRKAGA